jgi:tetratricopeptide (TPR) repeat protein
VTSQAPWYERSAPLAGLLLLGALLLFARSPGTGFVYDEQEAILASPYLEGEQAYLDAFRLDFWGLSAERTIGSYRPLPNLLWRPLAWTLRFQTPFFLQLLGPVLHALTAFSFYAFLRRHVRGTAPLVGAVFLLTLGITTEAVVSVVGQADLLVGLWTVLGLLALDLRWGLREAAIFCVCLLGLLSKETMLSALPLLWFTPLLLPRPEEKRLAQATRALSTLASSAASVVALVLLRRALFLHGTVPVAPELTMPSSWLDALVRLFEQPRLPIDPQNNPLLTAAPALRVPTALAIYASNFGQMLLPTHLAADYSFPRELPRGWTPGAVLGALGLLVPLGLGAFRWLRSLRSGSPAQAGLLTLGLLWTPLTYLPVSNLFVLLPTIRAERLLYLPAMGLCVLVAVVWPRVEHLRGARIALALSVAISAVQARAHALDYESDVAFWRATSKGNPGSAKAYLNLGVMLGARNDAQGRIAATRRSVELAPKWPMAHVYLGDALCRAGRAKEGIPHYVRGFELAPDHKETAALALQCLWQAGEFERAKPELLRAAAADPNGWLGFLLREVSLHGAENDGVPKAYRPRGYNEAK